MNQHLVRALMTSFGGPGGWLAASAYLHHLTPPIPGLRLLACWFFLGVATGLVAKGARRQFLGWAMSGFLFGALALVVAVALSMAPKRKIPDGGSV